MERQHIVSLIALLVFLAVAHEAKAADVCLEATTKDIIDFVVISSHKVGKLGETNPVVGSLVLAPSGTVLPFFGSAVRGPTAITVSALAFSFVSGFANYVTVSWQSEDETFQGSGAIDVPPLWDDLLETTVNFVSVSCSAVPVASP